MSLKQNNLIDFPGCPTFASFQYARDLERHCARMADPHSFHVTVDLIPKPRPKIKWTHNTDLHFGITRMSIVDYQSLIHPVWMPIYREFCLAAYRLSRRKLPELNGREAFFSIKLPLRQMDDSYWWYNQISRPCEFDSAGQMTAHFSSYYRLAPYGSLVPDSPSVIINDRPQPVYIRLLQNAGSLVLRKIFLGGLRPREFEVLYCYRQHFSDHSLNVPPPTNEELAAKLGVKIHGINKYNTRILTAARPVFPTRCFESVAELAEFLNALFGPQPSVRRI